MRVFWCIYFLLFFTIFSFEQSVCRNARWTVFNYIEADNNVAKYGLGNIQAMHRVGSTKDVNIVVQLDEPLSKVTWRYKIEKGFVSNDVSLQQEMGVNPEAELFQGINWARTAYPSDRFMVVLWNHGNGILDEPRGHRGRKKGRKKGTKLFNQNIVTRGILYDFSNNTYLNNQQLDRALNRFVTLNRGKKIDIIGMDACLMAMLEVAYQIKDYAKYFVASQNLEYVPGWHYHKFLSTLVSRPTLKNKGLAKEIVDSFALLNNYNSRYTQSAIRLKRVERLKDDVKKFLGIIEEYKRIRPGEIRQAILTARKSCPQFYQGNYVDLHSFYKNLLRVLNENKRNGTKFIRISTYQKIREKLKDFLKDAMANVLRAVIHHRSGARYALAQGISIYYPRKIAHPSYALTKFDIDTGWSNFIDEYMPKRSRLKKGKVRKKKIKKKRTISWKT